MKGVYDQHKKAGGGNCPENLSLWTCLDLSFVFFEQKKKQIVGPLLRKDFRWDMFWEQSSGK